MAAIGLVGAPIAILGIALALDATSVTERAGVTVSYLAFLAASIGLSFVRAVRPLGLGLVFGALALALMFLLTGGTASAS
jgi:hypothetical protein